MGKPHNSENPMDAIDREILDAMQQAFPLVPAPFAVLGQRLAIDESEVLTRVRRLKDEGIIRQIGPIFDSRRLGYRSTLAAFRVEPARLDTVARKISQHTGVSHNYTRNFAYNLWFTLTLSAERDMEEEISRMADANGVDDYINLPSIRTFKIGVRFDLSGKQSSGPAIPRARAPVGPVSISSQERDLVCALQGDLPLVSRPFREAASQMGVTEVELLEVTRELAHRKVMRRFAAVLRHRRVGFAANGMGCWVVPEERIGQAGEVAATFPQVSHCYQRAAFPPRWPYTLFTMVHGQKREDVEKIVERIHQAIGPTDHVILYSLKEYKKERVRYFQD